MHASEPVIINSGPLISLTNAGVIELLSKLPVQFITSQQVEGELNAKADVPNVSLKHVRVEKLAAPVDPALNARVDVGEASVIQLALEMGVATVCIDDKEGRRAARDRGLLLTGSLGLLLAMKNLKLIDAVRPILNKMLAAGFYVSDSLIAQVLSEAGEDAS